MKIFLAIFIASFLDPIRWIACICGAWFIRNFFGALAIGVGIPFLLTLLLDSRPNFYFLLIGALASIAIVSIFHFWRKSKLSKISSSAPSTN